MAARSRGKNAIPRLVSLRWCAVALGVGYGNAFAVLKRAGVPIQQGSLRAWQDVSTKLARQIAPADLLVRVAKHLEPQAAVSKEQEIPAKLLAEMRLAWNKVGAPGCPLLVAAKRGRPAGEKAAPASIAPEPENEIVALNRTRVRVQEETYLQKRQTRERMSGMMCDKATVAARSREAGLNVRRALMKIPALVTGRLVSMMAIPDYRLREIERSVEAMLPGILSDMVKDLADMERDARAIASSKRYGDRMWGADA